MRNASVNGAQALPPIDFPYPQASCGLWSLRRKDYKERMALISQWAVNEYKLMLAHDAQQANKQAS